MKKESRFVEGIGYFYVLITRRRYSRPLPQWVYDEQCTYCDEPANCLDHWIPYSKGGVELVPACFVCNGVAGNKVFGNILAKRIYIRTKRNILPLYI